MVPLVVTTFGKPCPAQGFLQSLADVACSTGVVGDPAGCYMATATGAAALIRAQQLLEPLGGVGANSDLARTHHHS